MSGSVKKVKNKQVLQLFTSRFKIKYIHFKTVLHEKQTKQLRVITLLKRRPTQWPTYANHITNSVRIVVSALSWRYFSMDVFYIFSNYRKYYRIYVLYSYTIFLIELM